MNKTEEIRQKIDVLIKEKNLSYVEISRSLGKNDAYIQQYIKGKPLRLPEDTRKGLAIILGVSEQLLTDKDLGNIVTPILKRNNPDGMAEIDIIDAVACCGSGIDNCDEQIIGKYLISQKDLMSITFAPASSVKMLRVEGDSMMPTLTAGDMVLVDTTHCYPTGDGLYVLLVGERLMVKRIQINPINNSVRIKSDNPEYAVINHDDYKETKTIGEVIFIYKVQKVR
ncbi:MAG: S24 family peptidase [Alphaproteobacteria bacterium]|nr:S24 family peptidase [Alphaproteobacteria bacterium]